MDRSHFGQHSSSQFNEEMESIRSHLMEMGGMVEKQVIDALQSLLQGDSELAERVLENEDKVDSLEKLIDGEVPACSLFSGKIVGFSCGSSLRNIK